VPADEGERERERRRERQDHWDVGLNKVLYSPPRCCGADLNAQRDLTREGWWKKNRDLSGAG